MKTLDDRHPRVLAVLLSSLLDYQPGPATDRRNPLSVRQPSATRFSPSEWEDCPGCKTLGRIKRGDGYVKCQRCEGNGGWYVDPYDKRREKIAPAGSVNVQQAARLVCQMQLPELERVLRRIEGAPGEEKDPLLDALDRQVRYRTSKPWARDLTNALLMLPSFDRLLLGCAYTVGWFPPDQMARPLKWRLVMAVVRLGELLPEEFRAPKWAKDKVAGELAAEKQRARFGKTPKAKMDRARRDEKVREWYAQGHPPVEIARRVGLSERRVWQILQREAA